MMFQNLPKNTCIVVSIHLGYFFYKNCNQELSKIAQSGHTFVSALLSPPSSFDASQPTKFV